MAPVSPQGDSRPSVGAQDAPGLLRDPTDGPRTVVVIPTYDEAQNITTTLDAVLAAAPVVDALVVDDNSPDGTAGLVSSHPEFGGRVHLVLREGRAGLGAAYRCGFEWALGRGYQVIAQMDADRSHPPERLPALLDALAGADVVIGSRYVPGGSVANWTLGRRLVSSAANAYVRVVLGLKVHDSTAGFRVFRRDALESIDVLGSRSTGYCFQIENTWRAGLGGLRVVEVPIAFTERAAGQSKMTVRIAVEAVLRVVGWRMQQLVRRTRRSPAARGTASTVLPLRRPVA